MFTNYLSQQIEALHQDGLYKEERVITSKQSGSVNISSGKKVLNFCANNYLGLADSQALIDFGKNALDSYGYGMASVRFICGTQTTHTQLETKLSSFLKMEDTILYSSCFDANTGLFETIFDENDAIISDALNHASIIDGVRLCKAKRFRYANSNMSELETCLKEAADNRFRLIVTDGVFSMDGKIANLQDICDLAKKYNAMLMVDDSHAVGVLGDNGRGTPEYCKVEGKVDIITGTLGKALGGASGGYTSGSSILIDWLRQKSRPYLFSNSLAPVITHTSLKVLELIKNRNDLREKLHKNTKKFRTEMSRAGFTLEGENHPIIPIMLGDAKLAKKMAAELLHRNIYVVSFSFPVVPRGLARIRTQMSATHSEKDIDLAIKEFTAVGHSLGII